MTSTTTPVDRSPDAADGARPGGRWDRTRVRRTGTYVLAVTVGVLLFVLLALSAQTPTAPLDPEGVGPEGGRALAQVLRSQGVDVEVVRSIDALEDAAPDAGTTVFLGDPANVSPGAAVRLAASSSRAARLVLVGVDTELLDEIGLPVQGFPGGGGGELVARCDSDVARRDDVVTDWDARYTVDAGSRTRTSCFVLPSPDGPPDQPAPGAAHGAAMVQVEATAALPETVVAGLGAAWTNELITHDSQAGTALRALGSTPRLLWYQPGTTDAVAPGIGEDAPSGDAPIWPLWTGPAVALLGCAVVLLALARGRRLGRLVREPLPVVVRAIATTESRGRLYRRAGDRARAAAVLRAGSCERLAQRLAIGRGAGPTALVHAVSLATGRHDVEVADILFGPAPPDDPALIHLAQQLTDLEERVRHP